MPAEKKYLYIAGGLVALLIVSRAKTLITEDLNPANQNNVVNRLFTGGYQALTGSQGDLGTDIYDVLHDSQGGNVLNPANQNNVINSRFTSGYKAVTGSNGDLGTDIYDILHNDKGQNVLNPYYWFN